jgi:hypothetical protein
MKLAELPPFTLKKIPNDQISEISSLPSAVSLHLRCLSSARRLLLDSTEPEAFPGTRRRRQARQPPPPPPLRLCFLSCSRARAGGGETVRRPTRPTPIPFQRPHCGSNRRFTMMSAKLLRSMSVRRLLGQQRNSVEFYRKSQAWNSTASFSDVDEKNRKGGDAEDDFTHSRPDHVFRGVHRVF